MVVLCSAPEPQADLAVAVVESIKLVVLVQQDRATLAAQLIFILVVVEAEPAKQVILAARVMGATDYRVQYPVLLHIMLVAVVVQHV